jgi:hypothetical protein
VSLLREISENKYQKQKIIPAIPAKRNSKYIARRTYVRKWNPKEGRSTHEICMK